MDHEPYLIVCNPCDEQLIASDERLMLLKNGVKPILSRPLENHEYIPVIIYVYYGTIYKCPECEAHSGTLAPRYPLDLSLFTHRYICPNRNKIPVEV